MVHLLYTSNVVTERLNDTLKPHGLTIPQFNVLRILRGQEGKPANLSTVQERMVTKMSNTTRIVDKLIHKSLVNRDICPTNRRKVEITITRKGLTLLNQLDKVIDNAENSLVGSLSEKEIEDLNLLLEKVRTPHTSDIAL